MLPTDSDVDAQQQKPPHSEHPTVASKLFNMTNLYTFILQLNSIFERFLISHNRCSKTAVWTGPHKRILFQHLYCSA